MKYYIIVFKNTHDAMAGEKFLGEREYNFRIMPTPTSITKSCGICIRVENEEDINKIKEESFEYKNIYCKEGSEYKEII
ncbi:DUF3343 domain-containing protein [Eubacterium multiforme]|uniref:Putative Se/S carrier protein-like domain-containing protein n=1 Tax=Eubacterium multiforme TaxID=83339 RepID=A0ABT9UXR8_9FIRM|nr:DUF3343 domain-containing protein [Eubacterium multiforme]MDQ0151116.1 hypothetical protein [Eubacterium multiforme]